MAYMFDVTDRTTTFKLEEYASERNGWDKERLHPMRHFLVLVDADGKRRQISVGQLEILLEYAEGYPHMGAVLDAVARGREVKEG